MANDPHAGVRPAGAPMVPMPRPGESPAEPLATEAVSQAREAGRELTDRARERMFGELERGSAAAGTRVHAAADDVRDMAAHLHSRERDGTARVADEIADRLERVSAYLSDTQSDQILNDARDFARRRPAVVAAGAAVAGIVVGRLARMTVGPDAAGNGRTR